MLIASRALPGASGGGQGGRDNAPGEHPGSPAENGLPGKLCEAFQLAGKPGA